MTALLLKLLARSQTQTKGRTVVGRLAGAVGIACNVLLFLAKLAIGFLSGSVSITADAMNNLSDAAGSVVTMLGFKLAEKPADEDHPYGHARFEYLSGLAVAALILLIGFELAKSSVQKIFSPTPVAFSWVLVLVLVLSIGVKLWLSLFHKKLGKRIDSAALQASAIDSRNDCVATGSVLLASVIEKVFGWHVDGWFGLAVAVFILYSGIKQARETISPLLGESGNPALCKQITEMICVEPLVLGYHDLMVHDYGPGQRFATMHVEMDKEEDPMVCHDIIDNLERRCLQELGVHLVVHYDPVVTGDAELENTRRQVQDILHGIDGRISIHDFRMVEGTEHTNLIFDMVLPYERMEERKAIRKQLVETMNAMGDTTFYAVVTFDAAAFNE